MREERRGEKGRRNQGWEEGGREDTQLAKPTTATRSVRPFGQQAPPPCPSVHMSPQAPWSIPPYRGRN